MTQTIWLSPKKIRWDGFWQSYLWAFSAIMPDEHPGFIFQGESQKQNFTKTYSLLTLVWFLFILLNDWQDKRINTLCLH